MGRQSKILIVESEPGHGAMLAAELVRQKVHYTGIKVERQESFLRALDDDPVDLILGDYTAPTEESFAALEAAHAQHPKIPFVVLTSSCNPGLLVEMFECGAAGYVRKQHLGDLAPIIHLALENAHQFPASTEIEIIREEPIRHDRLKDRAAEISSQVQPVCSRCHRISDTPGHWDRLDTYLRIHHQATVALGTCPDCAAEMPPSQKKPGVSSAS